MKVNRLGAGILTVNGFLTPDECTRFIQESETRVYYSPATIHTAKGERLYKDARNNDRAIFDDRELARHLYERALPHLPFELDGWRVSGFNDRFRYYRYGRNQQFAWHQDGTVRLSSGEESFLTFMIYLNDSFEGGSTDFGWESVLPVRGMALVFPHRLRHQGALVTSGVKYVLRTDVLYASGDASRARQETPGDLV